METDITSCLKKKTIKRAEKGNPEDLGDSTSFHSATWIPMFIAWLMIVKFWKQPICPSTEATIKEMGHLYYSDLKDKLESFIGKKCILRP